MNRLRSYLGTRFAAKLAAVLLSIALLGTMMPVTALAEEVVAASDITIGTAAPVNGAAISDGTVSFSGGTTVATWSSDGTSYAAASGTFAQSTVYRTQYVLTANSGYVFDPAAGVYQQGGASDLTSRIANLGSGTFTATVSQGFSLNDTLTIVITWPDATIEPSDVAIGTIAPAAGAAIADGTNTFNKAAAVITWSDNGTVFGAASGTFAADTYYYSKYVITANEGYAFDTTNRIYLDGAKSLKGRIAHLGTGYLAGASVSTTARPNDTLTLVVGWESTGAGSGQIVIGASDISIGTAAPVPSGVAANGTNMFNHATATYVEWSRETPFAYLDEGDPFVSGATYTTEYALKAASGYTFDSGSAYLKGGTRDLSSRIANLGSGAFQVFEGSGGEEIYIKVTWPQTGLLLPNDISIGTLAPVAEAAVANGANTFGHAAAEIDWSADNGMTYNPASGTYAFTTTYKTKYAITAEAGYFFDSAAGVYEAGGAKALTSRIANLGSGTYTAVVSGASSDTLTIVVTWPQTAAAPFTILEASGMSIGTVAPVTGANMANGTNAFAHTAASVTWSADNGASYASASGAFAPGKAYKTKYVLIAEAGYAFDPTAGAYDSIPIPSLGSGTVSAQVSTTSTSNDTLKITVTWPSTAAATIAANELMIKTIVPVTGASMADGANTFPHATASVAWSSDGGLSYAAASGVYAPNTVYRTKYVLTADGGYTFNSAMNAYNAVAVENPGGVVLSADVSTSGVFNDTLTIEITWPATGAAEIVPADISIGTMAPSTGATQANGTNAFAHAAGVVTWSSDGGASYAEADGAYAAAQVYKTKYVLTAMEGYAFDSAASVYEKNGARDLSGRIANLGAGAFSATVSTASSSNDTLTIVITWPATGAAIIVPADLSIGTAAPVTGAAQSDGSNSFNHVSSSIAWSADNGVTYEPAGGTFAIGKSYRTRYVLTAAAGYQFNATAGAYDAISIVNLGAGTFTAQVTTTSTSNDTLTIIVAWPATEIADSVKIHIGNTTDFRAYSGSTLIPEQGLVVSAENDYSITLVNESIDTTNPSAPLTAAMVKSIFVRDSLGNEVPMSVQTVSTGVAQNHPWSLQITIDRNATAAARLITVTVNTDTARRIDIRNLIGFTNPTIEYLYPTLGGVSPYEYGNYYYFLTGDQLKLQTTSSGLIPAGVQIVGKNTSKTSPVTNTLFDTTNYRFGYTFSMPSEPIFLSVTSTDGKAAHNIAVQATIPGVLTPTLSGGPQFVQATARAPATDYSGAIITVDPGSYNRRMYKVTGVEVRSDLLNVALPVTPDGDGTYSFVMPFTDANVTVLVQKIVSNPIETEITTNANAEMTVALEEYYPGDTIDVQIVNKDPAKYAANVQVYRVSGTSSTFVKQVQPANPYDSRMNVGIMPYASTAQLTAGATLKVVARFENVSMPVTTASAAQFSNYPARANLNEPITFSFTPPSDASKIYNPVVRFRDRLNNKAVYACTYVRSDSQDQTKSVYTCPAVTKNSIDLVELLYDAIDTDSPAAGGAPGATKLRNIASVSPNSRLAGLFRTINVFGTNMNGQGQVFIGTSPNPTVTAAVTDVTATSLVVQVPSNMLSRTMDVTYYVSSNGVQRSVTIPAAENLSHIKFGYMAVVSDSQFNHSVIVSESERDLTQQLGDRTPVLTIKGSFPANANMRGEYVFSGTTILNGGVAVYLPNTQSLLNVRDDLDGTVRLTMEKVNMTAGSFSIMSTSDGSIRLDKGIEYISDYARDEDGELEDPAKRNMEVSIRNQNKLTVVGSGMQAGITGATLLGSAVIFDGRIYFGMALPGSDTVGIDLNIDRLQYGMDDQGNLSFQGVTADGSFTPGTEISKKLLGGFGINGSAAGSIDTFNGKYAVAFDVDAKLANFASSLSLKKNSESGRFIPDSIKIIVGLENGIPVTPMTPIAKLTRVGGGVSGLADTISGNYTGIAPILILLTGDFEVGSLIPGAGLLEFSNVELAIGPSRIELSGNPTLLKMSIFDKFQAGIYVTQSSVSYQMQIAANILKNFSVILAGGNANLTYYRNNGFNLNGQLRGRLQVPEIEVGLFSIGPYTLLDSDVGLSNTNAYASFSLLGFGLKVNYAFGSGSVSVGRRSFAPAQTGPAGQTVYDENGAALGQINAFSNVRLVASSGGSPSLLRTLAVEPAISTNAEGTEHTVSFPAGLTEDYAVLVSADPDDLRILDPSGSPYGLTYPGSLEDGTPYYDDPNANAAVVSASTVMIRLGAEAGDWTIASGQPFDSSIIAIAPVPKIAGTSYDAGAGKVSWDLSGLDASTEDYQVEVRLSTDNGDDPNARSAGVLVHTSSIDAADVTDRAASGSYTFTEQDLNYLQSGQYYARVTLIGTPMSDASRSIPYASRNAKQAMNVVNPLAPGSISGVTVSAGGNGTIHAAWSAVSDADGYLVRLYDADGNAVMSPLTYTDEIGSDGNPTGNRVVHAGRPIEYQVAAEDEANGQIGLRFGGIDPGNSYRLAVTPFAYADDAEMNSSYIYGATTVTNVVDVPLVKSPNIHVRPSAGVIANDSLLGKVLTVGGDFTLDAATTYVSAEDGQTQDLGVRFTVWQSDGTIDENTNLPRFVQVYSSIDYENRISVPIIVDGDAGSTLLRIVAENDQGDVSEYGLAVHYNRLPPALFVETGTDGRIAADSAGRYRIAGSTLPYATVMDDRGNRTTADHEGQFSLSGTLSSGTQAYSTVTAIDSLGNVAQDDVSIVGGSQPANPGSGTGTNGGGTNTGTNAGSGSAPATEDGQTDSPTDNGTLAEKTFKDVHIEAAWAEEAIERAYKLGIVSGRTADLFAPNSHTRRDEAIAMLVRARKLAIGKQADLDAAAAHFADWHELAQWSRPYIAAAYANGLVTGKLRQGKLYVNGASLVTRAEAAVLFQNAYRLTADVGNRKTFGDPIPSWAANSVDILSSHGVINGYPNSTFLPASNATRAEIVVMLMRLIDRQEKDAPAKDE
ncbi:S-layer homology domain-containing protein [Cohnella cellulosilytica]|uniref:S-layer homology domain-containing protein n=1 Tax=Cohnella cellulosilytica TaxID=986710 RepID=A0ABW2FBL2_9BACL